MIRFSELVDRILSYNPESNMDLIRRAYLFAADVHQGQVRSSGEPYLVHPLSVAGILTDLRMDDESIVTALLHDTLEDTNTTIETINRLFGEGLANLVEGLTKINQISFRSKEEKQAENLRKMVMAMSSDIRIIIIKLADRLHNMQTLKFIEEPKRTEVSQETLDIYTPLAGRLGIDWLKVQLEDMCLKNLKPDTYRILKTRVQKLKKRKGSYIEEIRKRISDKLNENNIRNNVLGHYKHIYSIYKKMERQGIDFDQVHDIFAFRILVEDVRECYASLGVIHTLWKPVQGRFKDYLALPKSNNYQSLHTTVMGTNGDRMEVQIRTNEMDKVANEGVSSHWKYRDGRIISESQQELFAWLKKLVEWQKDLKDPNEFLESLKIDLFPDDVYVFTPKGDVKRFSKGVMPLDFAYAIHTDVGHRCSGCRVNGKIVPLDYNLRNGDIVEVLISQSQHPGKDWLKLAKTSKARYKIRRWLKDEERASSERLGREILEKGLKKSGLNPKRYLKSEEMADVLKGFKLRDIGDLFQRLGYGKILLNQVMKELLHEDTIKTEEKDREGAVGRIFKKVKAQKDQRDSIIQVDDMEDVLVHFAKCCSPIPGDPIIGYLTRGHGITIHEATCSQISHFESGRRVEVKWNVKEGVESDAKVRVVSQDRMGLLAAISQNISKLDGNISQSRMYTTHDNKAVGTFNINVKDIGHLRNIIRSIEKVPGVIHVERV